MLRNFEFTIFIMFTLYKILLGQQEGQGFVESGEETEYFNKCYEEIGCLETDSRWYDKNLRPVNLQPLERHVIKTDFLLLKYELQEADNPDNPESLLYNSITARHNSIKAAGFNQSSDLMILIHDFTSNGYTGWIKHLALKVFSESMDFNVISVCWQRGAEPPYNQAIANARIVALEIIYMIKEIKQSFNYSSNNIHIVGHGVGAHIASYVGMTFNDIRKITALDPSGIGFEGMPDIVKLNPSSAQYVEVIHTDAYDDRSQGSKEAMGHSDFFINNAENQPGCSENTTFSSLLSLDKSSIPDGQILPGCSHKRSFKYFIESLNSYRCTFLGIQCTNYDNFTNGLCTSCGENNENCRTFGTKTYKNSIPRILFFLNAGEHEPFCMFQYKISVIVEKDSKTYSGYFDLILVDDVGNIVEVSPSYKPNSKRISSSSNNTFVYYGYPPQLLSVKEAKVRWNEEKKIYCIIYCKQFIKVDKIYVESIGIMKAASKQSILCSHEGKSQIDSGSYRKFTKCGEHSEKNNLTTTTQKTSHSTIKKMTESTTTNKSPKSTLQSSSGHTNRTIENNAKEGSQQGSNLTTDIPECEDTTLVPTQNGFTKSKSPTSAKVLIQKHKRKDSRRFAHQRLKQNHILRHIY